MAMPPPAGVCVAAAPGGGRSPSTTAPLSFVDRGALPVPPGRDALAVDAPAAAFEAAAAVPGFPPVPGAVALAALAAGAMPDAGAAGAVSAASAVADGAAAGGVDTDGEGVMAAV